MDVTTKYLEILQNSKVKYGKCWQIVQEELKLCMINICVCVWNNWHLWGSNYHRIWQSQHQVISHNYWTFLCWVVRPNHSFLEISWSSLVCHRIALNISHPTATEQDITGFGGFSQAFIFHLRRRLCKFFCYSWFLPVWAAFWRTLQDWPFSPICLANSASQTSRAVLSNKTFCMMVEMFHIYIAQYGGHNLQGLLSTQNVVHCRTESLNLFNFNHF